MMIRSDIPRRFFTKAEQEAIVASIAEAETLSTGEIRTFIERDLENHGGDPYLRAREVFAQLGMQNTAERNGVLVYLAVRSRKFAIVGDEELHKLVGGDYWIDIRNQLAAEFAVERYAEGLVAAIRAIGKSLGRDFPPRPDDINELPDDIAY